MTFDYNVNKNSIEYNGKHFAYCNGEQSKIVKKLNELHKENEQLYELINFANTLIAFKSSESCQKEWEKKLKELSE